MKCLIFIFCALLFCTVHSTAAETRRPNILIILADDQAPHDLKSHNPRTTVSPSGGMVCAGNKTFTSIPGVFP